VRRAGASYKAAVVNTPPQPLLFVQQQHSDRLAVAMFQLNAHRIRVFNPDVCDQGHSSQTSRMIPQAAKKVVKNIHAGRTIAHHCRITAQQLGRTICADSRGKGEELATLGELLLGKRQRQLQQPVQVILGLLCGGIAP
jgi:hypothetical protein